MTFTQIPRRRTQQRLIPLTEEIRKAMMEFNASRSNTSIFGKYNYNCITITSLVRREIHNILQQLSIFDQIISKEEIDDLIEKRLKEKLAAIQVEETGSKLKCSISNAEGNQVNDDKEIVKENKNKPDLNNVMVTNLQILEQRVANIEELLKYIIPSLKSWKTPTIIGEPENVKEKHTRGEMNLENRQRKSGPEQTSFATEVGKDTEQEKTVKKYDDLYYERRQYFMNLLNYKKSLTTMELNTKPHFSHYAQPNNIVSPEQVKKTKVRPTFIVNN